MITSIEEYLDQLKRELTSSDPATIDKALADSEEHLRTALESGADLQSVIEEYGSPEELAAKYRGRGEPTPPAAGKAATESAKPAAPRSYRTVWIVIGSIIAFISLFFVVTGGGILIAKSLLSDEDGYLSTDSVRIDRDTYAIISETADLQSGPSQVFDEDLFDLKGEVEARDPGAKVFIGIAREQDLAGYLANIPHEKLTEYRFWSSETSYEAIQGRASPAPPATQTFWEQSAHGGGRQALSWEPKTGRWVFVIMNEDGSPGIDVDARVGVRVPWLFGIGLGLLISGLVGLTLGALMIIFPGRRRNAT